jgi:solute carrier family 10 (sodium/bile acid cotransporter), member 7
MSALTRVRPDEFTTAMLATVMLAFLLPCRGTSAGIFWRSGRSCNWPPVLSSRRTAVARGDHCGGDAWRLHLVIFAATFVLFPVVGLALRPLSGTLLTPPLYLGLLFLCTLPSTVQDSVAFWRLERFRM